MSPSELCTDGSAPFSRRSFAFSSWSYSIASMSADHPWLVFAFGFAPFWMSFRAFSACPLRSAVRRGSQPPSTVYWNAAPRCRSVAAASGCPYRSANINAVQPSLSFSSSFLHFWARRRAHSPWS